MSVDFPTGASDAAGLLRRALPMLIRLGDFIGNGPVDAGRDGSLGERCDLILDIRNHLAVGAVGVQVWVLHYEHRHGDDTFVHASEAGARAALAGLVRTYWHEVADHGGYPAEAPDDDDEAVRLYFAAIGNESYDIEMAVLGE